MGKIYEHMIKICFNGDKDEAIVKEHNILAENQEYLVIDDYHFTTLQFKKDRYVNINPQLESISIVDWSNERHFQYIKLYVYTRQSKFEKIKEKMAKEFDKWLYEKHGRFVNGYTGVSEKIKTMEGVYE